MNKDEKKAPKNEESIKQAENLQENITEQPAEETKEKTVEEQLEDAMKAVEEYKDKYLRQVAEFDNYRKRTIKEKAELILNGAEKTVVAVLPVLDDMERALANMDKFEDVSAVKEGVELIFQKFIKVLEEQGVHRIKTDGEDFNVDLHEAIAQVPAPDASLKGKIMDCVKTGYTLNEKVIRHSQVAVGL